MSLIGNFYGLLFNGAYTSKKIISERKANIEYEKRKTSYTISKFELTSALLDRELEQKVRAFVSNPINNKKIIEILSDELNYIYGGDCEPYMFGDVGDYYKYYEQMKVDLVMSKLGKLSWMKLYGLTKLGNLIKINESLDRYDESIRALQCIESNILNSTSIKICFGVEEYARCYCGKYCSSDIVALGMTMSKIRRIFSDVRIPFSKITEEQLFN